MFDIGELLQSEDFVIVIRPLVEQGNWTGSVQVGVISDPTSELSEPDTIALSKLCNMISASIPAMDQHSFIRHIIESYVEDIVIISEHEKDSPLTIHTPTKGNA